MIRFFCPECNKEVESLGFLGSININISLPWFNTDGRMMKRILYKYSTEQGICKECFEKILPIEFWRENRNHLDVILTEVIKKSLKLKSIRRI